MTPPTRRWQACLSGLALALIYGCGRPAAAPVEIAAPAVVRAESEDAKAEQPAPTPEEFHFPDDHGGRLLARLLTPERQPLPPETASSSQRRQPPHAAPNDLAPVLPPVAVVNPRLATGSTKSPLKPHLLVEETLDGLGEPARLVLPPLTEGQRPREPATDLNVPVPVPILAAQPLPDRASLDDPTTEVSLADALLGIIPLRTTPAPFQKQTPPDPFEFHHATGGPVLAPGDEEVPDQVRSPRQ